MAAQGALTSERFCAIDSDITFESCDQVLFKVHRKNLECTSEGFAPPDGTLSSDEIVPLAENATLLDLLFQYMYPQLQPDLKKIDFATLSDLAEAAEKYQVYPAMQICNIHMEAAYTEHTFEVLIYANKHGYPILMDLSEVGVLKLSPTEAFDRFPPALYIAWTRYYAQWLNILEYAHGFDNPATIDCHSYHTDSAKHMIKFLETLHRLGGSPASLMNLDFVFEPVAGYLSRCNYCCRKFSDWRSGIDKKIAAVAKFSTFL